MLSTEVADVRRRTRATQHVTSYPLLIIGVLFVNYGVFNFVAQPVQWRYASALAFVALWGLGKVNESAVGVGPARGDLLAIAAGVFTVTQLTYMESVTRWLGFDRLAGVWVAIIGAGLLALGFVRQELSLGVWGVLVGGTGLVLAIVDNSTLAFFSSNDTLVHIGQNVPVVVLGIVLTVAGLFNYERERRVA